jgi:serine/threonine protein phosphatase 1
MQSATSIGVVGLLLSLQTRRPDALICLKGNHEDMMLASIEDPSEIEKWLVNGGAATLRSYGADQLSSIPPEHLAWMYGLPTSFDDGLRHFVHAGIDPTFPLDKQHDDIRLWVREPWLSGDHDVGRLVVHGHTPLTNTMKPELNKHRLNLDTAAVFGGPLTAAAFTDEERNPIAFLNDRNELTELHKL